MEKTSEREVAAIRKNFAGDIYQEGVRIIKQKILKDIPLKFRSLHEEGYIHIHDLEGYGKVYNCSTPDLSKFFTDKRIPASSAYSVIASIFNKIKELIANLAMCQTGGIGFANFDDDIGTLFAQYQVAYTSTNVIFLRECIEDFFSWINLTRTRYCREPYYITLNIGLTKTKWGRKIAELLITSFLDSGVSFTRPNIVFKVNREINSLPGTLNYDLYLLALQCTAKRMIPTYLLTDSDMNKSCDPKKIGIMGCRTRVYQNINGEETVIGRGNIAYISLNLPRLALEAANVEAFFEKLLFMMNVAKNILLARVELFVKEGIEYFEYVKENNIWANVKNIEDLVAQGTLSFGFIGLSETVEILTKKKYYADSAAYLLAVKVVEFMREFVDSLRKNEKKNYSLLATPAEMLSGRFCDIDKKIFNHSVHKKNFYTNSFHVDVDSGLSLFEKIEKESPFHALCNGGCITYVEFNSAPTTNSMALIDAISLAELNNISYLGFNYPLDICNDCSNVGTFDFCNICCSQNIKRIRRISGYLEDFSYFTKGKKSEVPLRKTNSF